MTETDICKAILAAICKRYSGRGLFYRRNVGAIKIADRYVEFGIAGQADIAGILGGDAYEIEIKSATGRQSPAQKRWQSAVERAGGVYILARSVEDCLSKMPD